MRSSVSSRAFSPTLDSELVLGNKNLLFDNLKNLEYNKNVHKYKNEPF